MAQKINSTDYRDGGNQAFRIVQIHLSGGSLNAESLQHEINAWNAAQYQEKSPVELETHALASHSAQLREVAKAQRELLANEQSLAESHARISKLYSPNKEV